MMRKLRAILAYAALALLLIVWARSYTVADMFYWRRWLFEIDGGAFYAGRYRDWDERFFHVAAEPLKYPTEDLLFGKTRQVWKPVRVLGTPGRKLVIVAIWFPALVTAAAMVWCQRRRRRDTGRGFPVQATEA